MKTERRHELKSNELGAFLLDANDWAKKNATQLGTGALIVVLALLAIRFIQTSRARSTDDAIVSITGLSFVTPDEAAAAFDTLEDVIHEAGDDRVMVSALLRKGRAAMSLSMTDGFHPEYLDRAEAAFSELVRAFPARMPLVASALGVLATIEESRFAEDGKITHRAAAENYLKRLRDEPQFKGTPFQTDAALRLQGLDRVFQVIVLADPLPEPALPPTPLGPVVPDDTKPEPVVRHFKVTPDGMVPITADEADDAAKERAESDSKPDETDAPTP